MTQNIIFQDDFLISDIMCYQRCGTTIQNALSDLTEYKRRKLLPDDARISIDTEPQTLGINRYILLIESQESTVKLQPEVSRQLSKAFRDRVEAVGYEIVQAGQEDGGADQTSNLSNLFINVLAILGIVVLSAIFPPSLPLTIGLTTLCFLTTLYTARQYFFQFYRNFSSKNVFNMPTAITTAWFLSLAHSLYHTLTMGVMLNVAMTFMNFIMPLMLVAVINGMDEVKRLVLNKSKRLYLKGMKALFPGMHATYPCYELGPEAAALFEPLVRLDDEEVLPNVSHLLLLDDAAMQRILSDNKTTHQPKNVLKKDMIIQIQKGACFPVDGYIIQGETTIDASILTGEPQQFKTTGEFVPAGAINLGQMVVLYATKNAYHSTVNKILLRSNRAEKSAPLLLNHQYFTYVYVALVIAAIAAAVVIPSALGLFSVPLLLQSLTGILFAICPCTIVIALELPALLSRYRLQEKHHIIQRHDTTRTRVEDIHTIVFDKTGTLTTGVGEVSDSEGMTSALWQRIYILEKEYGFGHPIARAICDYCEKHQYHKSLFSELCNPVLDKKKRGLSADVQGKQLHVGNEEYLAACGIQLPKLPQRALGCTAVHVAEEGVYQGVILIRHQIRDNIAPALHQLKSKGIRLIMLTGDSQEAAAGLNQQLGDIFGEDCKNRTNLYAKKTPKDKEALIETLFDKTKEPNERLHGVWFIGDGLNDAPSARLVSEEGGVSCSMTSTDKASFFSDMTLNGSLDYLFVQKELNQLSKKVIFENQWILAYGMLAFLAFVICFPIAGIGISPLIPMVAMVGTTLFTLVNSYRVSLVTDDLLDKKPSWIRRYVASDLTVGILISASTLVIASLLIFSLSMGHVGVPICVFGAGAGVAVGSACFLAALGMLGGLVCLAGAYAAEEMTCEAGFDAGIKASTCNGAIHQQTAFETSRSHPGASKIEQPKLGFGFTYHKPVNGFEADNASSAVNAPR